MRTPASVKSHPLHPMLIPFPIALFVFSFIGDLIYRAGTGNPAWAIVAYYCIAGGIVGGLIAAVPGLIDYRSITDPVARKTALVHGALNVTIVAIFAASLYGRATSGPNALWPFVLSIVGIGMLLVSGWLGGDLVYVHGTAVDQWKAEESSKRGQRAA